MTYQEKLRKNAESLLAKAEKVNTEVSGNWTHRRQKFADSAQKKKDTFIKRARVLNGLADNYNPDSPSITDKIKSAGDIDFVFHNGFPSPPDEGYSGGWYAKEYPSMLKKAKSLGMESKEDAAKIKAALKLYEEETLTPAQEKERKLRAEIAKVRTYNIEGFFPTPDELVDKMIDAAELFDDCSLLEPSAGIGSILDRVVARGFNCRIDCVERQYSLENILKLKGYNSSCEDILETTEVTGSKWDRILMNPPFENGQDMQHIKHCYDTFLKEDGILVAIASSGTMSNSTKKYLEFREWLSNKNAVIINNGQAFKEAFNSTGTATVMIKLVK